MPDPDASDRYRTAQRLGLAIGAIGFVGLLLAPPPGGLSPSGWRTAAMAALMAAWWMTEAIPIPATALIPLVALPGLGVLTMSDAAAPYANELIFLFMGGFFLAVAMERWNLHRRLALGIVSAFGTGPRGLVLGFMIATAFLSMWISNTATAAMMLPVALAVGEIMRPLGPGSGDEGTLRSGGLTDAEEGEPTPYPFGVALMLGVAYGASIGGVATLIGTPPNAVMAGAANELLGLEIGFVEWMAVGVPVAAVMLPLAWLLLVTVLHPPGEVAGDAKALLEQKRASLGPMSPGEKIVGAVFAVTVLAWLARAPKEVNGFTIPGIQTFAPEVRDSTIAMAAALVLFLIPVDWKRGVFALDWKHARKIPWGVLVLFGGGLSLARAMDASGLAAWIGTRVEGLGGMPDLLVFGVVAALFVFLTEITSNTATSTMAMPVMAGAAVGLGLDPLSLMGVAALAASMAFMLPVATPPNAIVFGSGYLTIQQMVKAGFWLNLVAILLIALLGSLLLPTIGP